MNYTEIVEGFEIVSAGSIIQDMVDYAEKGALKGVFLGFDTLHEFYSMALPGVTDWTGFPRSGKSVVLREILLNTSIFYGWRHLVYFPDAGDAREIIAELIHRFSGKTFDKRFKNHIKPLEVMQHTQWICEHFLILTKKDLKAKLTPYEFWDLAAKVKYNDPRGLQTASIDSWKDMHHDTRDFGRDDKYLEDVFSYRNAMAEKHFLHFHTIAHPKVTNLDKNGKRLPPLPYDMKGGTEWFNGGKNMITVHREGDSFNQVSLYVNKVKPKSVGKEGKVTLYLDVPINAFYEETGIEKKYAHKDYVKPIADQVMEQETIIDDDLPF